MSYAPGEALRARIAEIDAAIATSNERVEKVQAEVAAEQAPLKSERKALDTSLKAIDRALHGGSSNGGSASNGSGATAVSDEAIINAIKSAGKRMSSKEVGEALGVTARHVSRKLRKLADEGKLVGDKDTGYEAAAATAAA